MQKFLGLVLSAWLACVGIATSAYERTATYEQVKVYEWTVLIAPSLNASPAIKNKMMRNLTAQLERIRTSVSPSAMKHLVKTRIWLELRGGGKDARYVVGQYFPSRTWLRNNGMNPEKYEDVQLNALFAKDGTKGTVVFHELAHVFHDRQRRWSRKFQRHWEDAWIKYPDAFDTCGGRKTKAYAFQDPGEFFATYSQAYLGRTCSFPYDRATLKKLDPKAYEILRQIWGDFPFR